MFFRESGSGIDFQDPGGKSALRRSTKRNPRNLPCPTCGQPNKLTPADKRAGYQCDDCADRAEGTYCGSDYQHFRSASTQVLAERKC